MAARFRSLDEATRFVEQTFQQFGIPGYFRMHSGDLDVAGRYRRTAQELMSWRSPERFLQDMRVLSRQFAQHQPGGTPAPQAPDVVPPPPEPGGFEPPPITQTDAHARIRQLLREFGLDSLSDWAWQQIIDNRSHDEVVAMLREREEYHQRFPAMRKIARRGRALSEAEYIGLEKSYANVLQSLGFPHGFFSDPDDFEDWIEHEVSPAELRDRGQEWVNLVYEVDPVVRQQFRDWFGVSEGDLAAYFVDPKRALPLLQNRVQQARLGGEARLTGFGGLSRQQAEMLQRWGIDPAQARGEFSALAQAREVFSPLPGREGQESHIGKDTQLRGVFAQDAQAAEKMERQRRGRVAEFAGSPGGYAGGGQGLGRAR